MSKLICDICGTSYSEDVEKCPTCGYSRAFEESVDDAARRPAAREKIRGGRFSKKNVRKRLQMLEKASQKPQEPVPAVEMGEELGAAVASVMEAQQMPSVPEAQLPVEPAEEPTAVQETVAEPVIILLPDEEEPVQEEPAEETESDPEPVLILLPDEEEPAQEESAEETESDPEPILILLPDEEEPAQEEPAEETESDPEPVLILLPDEEAPAQEKPAEETESDPEPVLILLPDEEAPAQEEPAEETESDPEPVLILLPDEETPEQEEAAEEADIPVAPVVMADEEDAVSEEGEKKKKGGCLLHAVLYTALAVFLAAAFYLLVSFGIPYLKPYLQNMDLPSWLVAETTTPTEEPTQAPTEAPTEAPTDAPTQAPTEPPTDPPTEAPTEAPTDPPTEAPTEPLLDVKLALNYYDLTFGAANQATQLKANVIPNEDITWISDDPGVVTISDTGLITSVGGGRTTVRAIYGDQECTVKINCPF